jgi:galactokinase
LREKFRDAFGGNPRVFRAPGRVNLIGEHVDYNEGWVLPIAIDRYCYVLAQARDDNRLRIRSEHMSETCECAVGEERAAEHHWSDYLRGVAWALRRAGIKVGGADLLVSSEVPIGSGLSSSAALEVATALALLGLYDQRMERKGLALACQRAESEYVGMRCGIMDQFAACLGRLGHALLIDCRTLEVKAVSLDETLVHVVVANTMTRHALASSEYNVRRQECEECVRRIREFQPHLRSLRDVTWEEIAELAATWPENLRQRARHVTTEMARVHSAIAALQEGNFDTMGRLMAESHASLDADYQVTSRELNLMVALAQELPGLYGARMTGAGFGGCTVNLVRATEAESFATELASRYEQATGLRPEVYNCRASEGGGEV